MEIFSCRAGIWGLPNGRRSGRTECDAEDGDGFSVLGVFRFGDDGACDVAAVERNTRRCHDDQQTKIHSFFHG